MAQKNVHSHFHPVIFFNPGSQGWYFFLRGRKWVKVPNHTDPTYAQRVWALGITTLGFLINGPLLTLLPGFLDAGFLPGFSASKSLSAPTGHLMTVLLCLGPQ